MLSALAPTTDKTTLAVEVVRRYRRLPGALDDLRTLLPFLLRLAKIIQEDECLAAYTRIKQDDTMFDLVEYILAEGKAEGKAEGAITAIRDLVSGGLLPIDAARSEINKLIAQGTIPDARGREAIRQLG